MVMVSNYPCYGLMQAFKLLYCIAYPVDEQSSYCKVLPPTSATQEPVCIYERHMST